MLIIIELDVYSLIQGMESNYRSMQRNNFDSNETLHEKPAKTFLFQR